MGAEEMLTPRSVLGVVFALGLSIISGSVFAQDDEPDDDLHRPDRLTVGVADDLLGQLAPDGKTLYFVSNRDTTNQLFAQDQESGREKLLFDDDADVTWPRVSPDGKLLLYISFGENASGELCVRRLPDGDERRCLEDTSAALQAEWIDTHRIVLVGRQSIQGDLRISEVSVSQSLSARALFDRNVTSPAVSPDGRVFVYAPLERSTDAVGPAFAAHAASHLEAVLLGAPSTPSVITLDLPGVTGQPVFSRDGRYLFFVQFFFDSNRDGVIDASDVGVLFRAPISFKGNVPTLGFAEQLTDTSWNCEYPAPSATKLIATCSKNGDLDIFSLPLSGEVRSEWTVDDLTAQIDSASSRVVQQLLSRRRLGLQTTPVLRRRGMMKLAMLHLDLDEFRAAEFYARRIATLRAPGTAGISAPLLALVDQRRAWRERERGRMMAPFRPAARKRLDELQPKATASPMAVALTHVVRSEIASSIGDETQARAELDAVKLDEETPESIIDQYYRRADALYRHLDDREALISVCSRLAGMETLPPDTRLRYARAAVRAMVRGLPFGDALARVVRERGSASNDSELAFALDVEREVLAIEPGKTTGMSNELTALYLRQSRPGRRRAMVDETVRRATLVGASGVVDSLAQLNIETVKKGTGERRTAERLYRRVLTARAFHRKAEGRFDEARADFDAMVRETGSLEAVVGAIDMRLKMGVRPAEIEAFYSKKDGDPARSHFAKAYLIARQLPKLDGSVQVEKANDALKMLRGSWADLLHYRIVQALYGALLHEEYLRTRDLGSAEEANLHYLVALQLMGKNPRFRAMILGELGLLQTEVGNFRIALGYLLERDKIPYTDSAEGLAVHLAKARALLHADREAESATTADEALAMIARKPGLERYRLLALDRAALDHFAAGDYSRAVALYDTEIPLLDGPRGPAADRNRFVTRLMRAAAAIRAGAPARALDDLAFVDRQLATPGFGAAVVWPHASPEHVVESYRLIAAGLRAAADRRLGRFDAETAALTERRAILAERFASTKRTDGEKRLMAVDAELGQSANDRHDLAAMRSFIGEALAHADDLHARAHEEFSKEQLNVLMLASKLSVATRAPVVPDLPARLRTAVHDLSDRPALRYYERWLEIYQALTGPAGSSSGAPVALSPPATER